MPSGELARFVATGAKALILVAGRFDSDLLLALAGNDEEIQRALFRAFRSSLTLAVDYDRFRGDMIREGRYDYVDQDVFSGVDQEKRIKPTGIHNLLPRLIHPDVYLNHPSATEALNERGLRAATIEEGLAFGARHPNLQRRFPIFLLGSSFLVNGSEFVGCLYGNSGHRSLGLKPKVEKYNEHYGVMTEARYLAFASDA